MNTPHTDAAVERIYQQILKDMELPEQTLQYLNITRQRIKEALNQCASKGLSSKQSEELVIKVWENSTTIK